MRHLKSWRNHLILGSCLCLGLAAVSMAQEKKDPDKPAADDMAKMMEMMAPGPHHAFMKDLAGSWVTKSSMTMDPSQPPVEADGTATLEIQMDGRFLSEVANSPMMGMPWEGRGVYGYDKGTSKHIGIWYDSMGTMIMNFTGDCDGKCNVISMYSDWKDPMSNSMKRMKIVRRIVDHDHHVVELYDVDTAGKEMRMGTINYTRKK